MSKWFNVTNDTTLDTGDIENILNCIEQSLPALQHTRAIGTFRKSSDCGPEGMTTVCVPRNLIFVWDTAAMGSQDRFDSQRRLFVRPGPHRNAYMIPNVIKVRPLPAFLGPLEIIACTQGRFELLPSQAGEIVLRLLALHHHKFEYNEWISSLEAFTAHRTEKIAESLTSLKVHVSWPEKGRFKPSRSVLDQIKSVKSVLQEVGLCIERNDMLLEMRREIQLGSKKIEKSGAAELEYYNSRLLDDIDQMREVNEKRFTQMKLLLDEK